MDYGFLHEVEVVRFRPETPRPLAELLPVFEAQGFRLDDDVLTLDRPDSRAPWQPTSIVEVKIYNDDDELFGFDDGVEWTSLALEYIFASLPFVFAEKFATIVQVTAEKLDLIPELRGEPTDYFKLLAALDDARQELESRTGEQPGSEGLAIYIQSTYPRR